MPLKILVVIVHVHVSSQKTEKETNNMKKCHARSSAREYQENRQDFSAKQYLSFIGHGNAIKPVDHRSRNEPQQTFRAIQPAINCPKGEWGEDEVGRYLRSDSPFSSENEDGETLEIFSEHGIKIVML